MKKLFYVTCDKYRKLKNPKISYSFEKNQFFLLFAVSAKMKKKRYLTKENQPRY